MIGLIVSKMKIKAETQIQASSFNLSFKASNTKL